MAKPIHSMIRVLDEERSVAFYRQAMGLEIADRFDFDSFTLIYMRDPTASFELELTINKGRTEPYQLGDGYGHLAVAVDDLEAARERMTEAHASPGEIKSLELIRDHVVADTARSGCRGRHDGRERRTAKFSRCRSGP